MFPLESANYQRKQFLNSLSTRVPPKAPIEEQERLLEQNVRESLQVLENFEQSQLKIKEDAMNDIQRYRDIQAKKPQDMSDIPDENGQMKGSLIDPQQNIYHFRNSAELEQLNS